MDYSYHMWIEETTRDLFKREIKYYVALIFINQPNFIVKWNPSRVFLKDVYEQFQMAASAGKICWSRIFELEINF